MAKNWGSNNANLLGTMIRGDVADKGAAPMSCRDGVSDLV